MWEEYADKYAGFVIEYDLALATEQPNASSALARTFPVTYYKRLPKVPLLPFIERSFYKDLYGKDIDVFEAANKSGEFCPQHRKSNFRLSLRCIWDIKSQMSMCNA